MKRAGGTHLGVLSELRVLLAKEACLAPRRHHLSAAPAARRHRRRQLLPQRRLARLGVGELLNERVDARLHDVARLLRQLRTQLRHGALHNII